jgi:hypothetical protein
MGRQHFLLQGNISGSVNTPGKIQFYDGYQNKKTDSPSTFFPNKKTKEDLSVFYKE